MLGFVGGLGYSYPLVEELAQKSKYINIKGNVSISAPDEGGCVELSGMYINTDPSNPQPFIDLKDPVKEEEKTQDEPH